MGDERWTPLTENGLELIMNGKEIVSPVFQVLGTRRIAGEAASSDRYRLLVSDGLQLHSFAMLATQLNSLYTSGELQDLSIIQVDQYKTSILNKNEAGEKRVIILLDLKILHAGSIVGKKIGDPVPYSASKPVVNQNKPQNNQNQYKAAPQNNNNLSSGSSYRNNTAVANESSTLNQSLTEHLTMPINSLSPYHNKWVIKARVTGKSAIRTWSNAKGEGKLFNMDFKDETGEIRATAFRDQVDKYYDIIEVDKIYYISKCTLKQANKQYSNIKNDYEMTFGNETLVQECIEDCPSIPTIQYDLVSIANIANMEVNMIIDVIGVCKEVSDLTNLTAKSTGRELTKRDITLLDSSNAAIQLTLWGEEAKNFDGSLQPVILVKGAKVSEFGGGKTLSLVGSSIMKSNPDFPEGHRLRYWYDNEGVNSSAVSLSARSGAGNMSTEWCTFREAKDKNLGGGDKPDYFQTRAFVHNVVRSGNIVYKACPLPTCQKKVVDQDNGQFRCDKCNADYPNFKYRLLINMLVGDWSGNRYVSMFSEQAESLLGKTSKEVGEALENDKETADEIFSQITFKNPVFKLRTKVESYGDVPRNKTNVLSAAPVNYKEYNAYLIKNIQQITGVGKADIKPTV